MIRVHLFARLVAFVAILSTFGQVLAQSESSLFSPADRGNNKDGSQPVYKNSRASVEARVADLLPRMTLEEKVAQLIQGDMNGWMNFSDPLDNTLTHNATGLVAMMSEKAGSIWGGYQTPWEKFAYSVRVGQEYLLRNTTLGIPALIQSEALHGFTNNGTIFPSPIGLAATFNTDLIQKMAEKIADEAEGLGINHVFAPVLDLGRELRWGRVEEGFGEDPFLSGEIGAAYVRGVQSGRRRNTTSSAIARIAATCKHFAAFGDPQGGLNLAPVHAGPRQLRTIYLPPFERACIETGALSIMTAYSSRDGVPVVADKELLTDILRNEWGYPYWVTTDAGSVDLLITLHGTCTTRECAAKLSLENGLQGEMGGGTYTYLTLADQVRAGTVDEKYIDETVKALLRTKFSLGLFENPFPYDDFASTLRTEETKQILHQVEHEAIVLLENKDNTLPFATNEVTELAVFGPLAERVNFGDYVFFNASNNGISPLAGLQQYISSQNLPTKLTYTPGASLWSTSTGSTLPDAINALSSASHAVVIVGTWSLDQTLLWTPGTNATTGEHVDLSDLSLVGGQSELVQAVVSEGRRNGKKVVVVFVSGKPVTVPGVDLVGENGPGAVVQQFYQGELGGLALAEVLFGAVNPSGKLPVSFPRSIGTAPAFYDYLKGARPIDPGRVLDDGTIMFGHQYVIDSPVPLWGFGRGLSYTTFTYSNLRISPERLTTARSGNFTVSVSVTNSGTRAGDEVVQVYVTDTVASVVTANQFLAGFERVSLNPGETKTVSIGIRSSQLAIWGLGNAWVIEPGTFAIKVGTSEEVYINGTLTVA